MKEEKPKNKKRADSKSEKQKKSSKKTPYHRKPGEMDLRAWQIQLHRQYGQTQQFQIENVGIHSVYSEFKVVNPEAPTDYKVVIRGKDPGKNFCSRPDFKSNTLGTCKHIEATLHRLWHTRGLRQYFKRSYEAAY